MRPATSRSAFAEAYVHPPMPDDRFPWALYNTWGYGEDIHEAQQLEAVERCARMGVEAVVLDLGWAERIGDWWADPVKFPRGLAPNRRPLPRAGDEVRRAHRAGSGQPRSRGSRASTRIGWHHVQRVLRRWLALPGPSIPAASG